MTSSDGTTDRLQGLADELDYWRAELGGGLSKRIRLRLDPATRREQCHYRVAEYVELGAQRFPDTKLRVLDVGSGKPWNADEPPDPDPLASSIHACMVKR